MHWVSSLSPLLLKPFWVAVAMHRRCCLFWRVPVSLASLPRMAQIVSGRVCLYSMLRSLQYLAFCLPSCYAKGLPTGDCREAEKPTPPQPVAPIVPLCCPLSCHQIETKGYCLLGCVYCSVSQQPLRQDFWADTTAKGIPLS